MESAKGSVGDELACKTASLGYCSSVLDLRLVGFLTVGARLLIELFAVTFRRRFAVAGASGRPRLEALAIGV